MDRRIRLHRHQWVFCLFSFVDCSSAFCMVSRPQKIPVGDMADSVLKALKSRYNGRSSMQQTTDELGEYSMELMRLNVQSLFDKEIETILQKYMEVSKWKRMVSLTCSWTQHNLLQFFSLLSHPYSDILQAGTEKCSRESRWLDHYGRLRECCTMPPKATSTVDETTIELILIAFNFSYRKSAVICWMQQNNNIARESHRRQW